MKKALIPLLLILLVFLCVCIGVLIGRASIGEHILVAYDAAPVETVPATEASTDSPIDINTATLEQFMTLPGIGEVLAKRIIDYRTQNGAFQNIDELTYIEGIGITTLEQIREQITVGG